MFDMRYPDSQGDRVVSRQEEGNVAKIIMTRSEASCTAQETGLVEQCVGRIEVPKSN